ncbi:hypothetical protein ACFC0N_30255 [Streptomyces zaomyceticus]|uniref:hypothetical protein n=1 Tax=Streptomyces zaomyceticus TaxID=68286 RepID=UPI0035DD6717
MEGKSEEGRSDRELLEAEDEAARERRGALCGRISAAGITVQDILGCEDRAGFAGSHAVLDARRFQ